ncbi:hypothetical protein [Haloarchaeobius amylolyticus]|uniref:hypothetical protein n=1 Tax=Haloarchaeobius amylolyticus TaxID=1198296 RepID=UPI0022716715|nr:hypothetical protein [Haloarchaeobius amylolyticus]
MKILEEYYYGLTVEDGVEDYCVVVEKKADSNDIRRNSLMRKRRRQHETLVMKNKLLKKKAMEKGAINLEESGVRGEELVWKPR